MEDFMNTLEGWLGPVWNWFEPGLVTYAGNGEAVSWMPFLIQLGVIALVLAILMRGAGASSNDSGIGTYVAHAAAGLRPGGTLVAVPPFAVSG